MLSASDFGLAADIDLGYIQDITIIIIITVYYMHPLKHYCTHNQHPKKKNRIYYCYTECISIGIAVVEVIVRIHDIFVLVVLAYLLLTCKKNSFIIFCNS